MQERTGGRIHIIVESEAKLGSESEVLEQIKYGGIAFARVSLSQIAEQAPETNVLQLPYLYRDSEHMWRVLDREILRECARESAEYERVLWKDREEQSRQTAIANGTCVSTLSAEEKNEGIKFQRIDADVTDALKSKTSKKAEKEMEEQAESISKLMKKALKNDKITVKVEKLKNKKISSMITLSEESRRMQDMMKMYSMPGMDMSAFGGEGETLILNASHPLVQYITEHQDGENAEMICEQLYYLAKLQHAPLSADAMTKFVARSNDIMMLLTK